MYKTRALAGLLALLASETLAAREPTPLEPSSVWLLDYADERCSLTRDFGSGPERVQLRIMSYGTWNLFHTIVSGPGVTGFNRPIGFASFRFAGDPDDRETEAVYGTVGEAEDPAASFSISFAPYFDEGLLRRMSDDERRARSHEREQPDPAFDATVDRLWMKLERGAPIELRTGGMAEPLAALRACVDDLFQSWGADPAKQKTLSRSAEPLKSTVRKMQYPTQMLSNGMSAFVPVRLSVDAAGNPGTCIVQVDQLDTKFKQAVCDGLASKFEPALDAKGQPTNSIETTSVIYRINP